MLIKYGIVLPKKCSEDRTCFGPRCLFLKARLISQKKGTKAKLNKWKYSSLNANYDYLFRKTLQKILNVSIDRVTSLEKISLIGK